MANLKDIAATLAILGSGVLVMSGCGKDKPATETPGGAEAAGEKGAEGSCGAGKGAEGSCGAKDGEGGGEEASCSAKDGEGGEDPPTEGSCGSK